MDNYDDLSETYLTSDHNDPNWYVRIREGYYIYIEVKDNWEKVLLILKN